MITRIVKMSFSPKGVNQFLKIFERYKDKISAQKGCIKVDLFHDKKDSNVFFTISLWESEEDLNLYRKSDLFGEVWPQTKSLFNDSPKAWSLLRSS